LPLSFKDINLMVSSASFLSDLSPADMTRVMQHPAQRATARLVAALIRELRVCRTPVDYDEFQRRLFQALHSREVHKGQCRRCAHRLQRGKRLPDPLPQLPEGADPGDPETWRIEDLVYDRICHQLRAVGDGLAWRASGYDRRYVIALSSNAATGTMAGNTGLPRELDAAAAIRATGSFGLLHDLTNCLRIGDITEFRPDGSKLLYEIKSSPNAKTGPQRRRMKAAVEAVMTGGELPGRPGTRIITPTVRCRTHIRSFVSAVSQAHERGIAGIRISDSRALTACSFPALARTHADAGPDQLSGDFNAARQNALEKAGIASALHHVRVMSPTRNHDFVPSVMPFALFPLAPELAALLICDYIVFDITASPERVARTLNQHGITTDIPLALANDMLTAPGTVITLSKGHGMLQLHPGALYELMIECLDLATWTAANTEILDAPDSPPHPVLAFATTKVWR
jgi:hypothetical protein